jgi:hypothetical protein
MRSSRGIGRRILATLVLAAATAWPAEAMEQGAYSMEVLVDGRPVQELSARDRIYLEAIEGREYSIRLRNRTGTRVAVALSVDGLNTIDARTTTAGKAAKWILGPHQSITIDGWQTGPTTARRCFFTSEDRSYGAWLGKTRNLGVIAAAFYKERRARPTPIWNEMEDSDRPSGPAGESRPSLRSRESGRKAKAESLAPDNHAATGIGQEVGHSVRRVHFDAEPSPAAVLQVRYEYRDALVRLGVMPSYRPPCDDVLKRREAAGGFEGLEFAPDPYRGGCE